jgi:hypothetical protein
LPVAHRRIGVLTVLLTWNLAIAGVTGFLDQLGQYGQQMNCFDQAPNCPPPSPLAAWGWVEAFAVGNIVFVLLVLAVRRLAKRRPRRPI